jgi:8-oxo-dGTP diphosphatase
MSGDQNIRVAVDAIVFGYQNNQLYVLLIQQKFGTQEIYWALPGGLVQNDESLQDAVKIILNSCLLSGTMCFVILEIV